MQYLERGGGRTMDRVKVCAGNAWTPILGGGVGGGVGLGPFVSWLTSEKSHSVSEPQFPCCIKWG